MTSNDSGPPSWPARVAVIGGGRWARVLTEVLCGIAPPAMEITVHSPRNAGGMAAWAALQPATKRVGVSSQWPCLASPENSAALVVNAVRDHAAAIDWLLGSGVAVLVEKPMATSAAELQRLVEMARQRNVRLAPAHIFRFATNLDRFAALVRDAGPVSSLRVWWSDPRSESRHGGAKRYDPSLPIFADWLPHVLSVISGLVPDLPQAAEKLVVLDGGSQVRFDLVCSGLTCKVELIRNSDRRRRIVEARAGAESLRLDFSQEPAIVYRGDTSAIADADWSAGPVSSARMLTAFFSWAAGGAADPRLDMAPALTACRLSDQLLPEYRVMQARWVDAALAAGRVEDDDLRYAADEILQSNGWLPSAGFEPQIERLKALATRNSA